MTKRSRHLHQRRRGFTMIEALMAVTFISVTGAALLTSISASVRSSTQAARTTLAEGLANQLMEEIAATGYPNGMLIADSSTDRSLYNDIDDFVSWSASPPETRTGTPIGTEGYWSGGSEIPRPAQMRPDDRLMSRLTRSVVVERVEPDAGTQWNVVPQHTGYRRVTVRVHYTDPNGVMIPLAEVTRIFSNVPVSS